MASLKLHANNFATTLNGAITNVATSIILTSATGLPTLSGSEFYHLTIDDGTNIEIVKVTADGSSPTLTVVRAQEGTTGFAFADLDTVQMRMTADDVDRKLDDVEGDTSPILGGNLDANTFDITDVGSLLVGTTTGATNSAVSIISSDKFISVGSNITDATTKTGGYTTPHYTNSEQPVSLMYGAATASDNTASIGGGGSGLINAATKIIISAAANTTTTASSATEIVRFTTSGLSFNGGTNYLNNYEEGTWTGVLEGSTTPGSHTYSTQTGTYTREGDVVHINIFLSVTTIDGAIAGSTYITGLPFTAATGASNNSSLAIGRCSQITATPVQLTSLIPNNTTRVQLETLNSGGNAGAVAVSALANGLVIHLTGSYKV